jgi:ABC-type glycerol-3-phosphate transport system permease component
MSQELVTCLIAVAVNLIGMLVIYAVLSHALTHLAWHGRGTFGVVALILVAQLFWIAPAVWIVEARRAGEAGAYALWLGNWLVSGFSIVLLLKSAARIPVALADTARMDGLGGFAAWRHIVLPFVRRDLVLIAAFTVMATLLPFWGCLTLPEAGSSIVLFQRFLTLSGRLAFMAAISVAGAVPLFAIFFLAKSGRSAAVPSRLL